MITICVNLKEEISGSAEELQETFVSAAVKAFGETVKCGLMTKGGFEIYSCDSLVIITESFRSKEELDKKSTQFIEYLTGSKENATFSIGEDVEDEDENMDAEAEVLQELPIPCDIIYDTFIEALKVTVEDPEVIAISSSKIFDKVESGIWIEDDTKEITFQVHICCKKKYEEDAGNSAYLYFATLGRNLGFPVMR